MSGIIGRDLPTQVFDVFRVAQLMRGTLLEHAVAVDLVTGPRGRPRRAIAMMAPRPSSW